MGSFLAEGYLNGGAGMFGLCYTTASDFGAIQGNLSFETRYSDEAHQVGLLYGIAHTTSSGHVAIAGGPCFAYGQNERTRYIPDPDFPQGRPEYFVEKFRTVGVTISAQGYLHVAKTSGLGLTYVQTISPKRTWGGLHASFTFGFVY